MNKRKMRMVGWAVAAVLAMVPFMHGCSAGSDAPGMESGQSGAGASTVEVRPDASGEGETVQYGQVMAVNGDEVTVVVGELAEARDGSGSQTFSAGQDEVTFDKGGVSIVDETGAVVEGAVLAADELVVMKGTGEGSSFKPEQIEVVDVAEAGVNADDARVPEGL